MAAIRLSAARLQLMAQGNPHRRRSPNRGRAGRGASLAEFVLVVPLLLFLILALLQFALAFHAKSQLDYATVVAARAGTMANASRAAMAAAFTRAMTGYYGGGRNESQLLQAMARAAADLSVDHVRIEVLSPTVESFGDYNSPELQRRLNTNNARVIPNDDVGLIECPRDVSGCNPDPRKNRSGQTLADANLLQIRVTYGIPAAKQVPIVGRFLVRALAAFNPMDSDTFRRSLLAEDRIPLVAHTVLRMQSPAIEDHNLSNPGAGNNGMP